MDQLEFKDANQWHVVNLRTIGGKIRHEKGSLKCIWLGFLVLTCETKLEGKKGSKKKVHIHARETNSATPFQAIQVILMSFQIHFKCSSCP